MTKQDLERGNQLTRKMEDLSDNIERLTQALGHNVGGIKRFFFSRKDKNAIHIDGDFTSFAGYLKVDRECMELIKTYFENKLAEARAEFESIGKDEEVNESEGVE